jgi:hypothetical protein
VPVLPYLIFSEEKLQIESVHVPIYLQRTIGEFNVFNITAVSWVRV